MNFTQIPHYAYDQRIYLRRDPSQFGRIGCGGYGDVYDFETRTQLVFWDKGADIVSSEKIDDLMGQEEYSERRRLFFSVMRKPEMHVLRLALRHLLWDKGWEWSDVTSIQSIWVDPYLPHCWQMLTDRFQVVSVRVSPTMTYEDFWFSWLHNADDPLCKCEYCQIEEAQLAQA